MGIPFFLELKERIREEFNPDFLLIDARTGITEIGGVATTVLPEKVVVLLLTIVLQKFTRISQGHSWASPLHISIWSKGS